MLKSFPRNEIETLKVGNNVVFREFCGIDYVFREIWTECSVIIVFHQGVFGSEF